MPWHNSHMSTRLWKFCLPYHDILKISLHTTGFHHLLNQSDNQSVHIMSINYFEVEVNFYTVT